MRSQPVDSPHWLEYRATILVTIAAAGLSFKWFQGMDLSFLTLDERAWPAEPWRLLTACLLHGSYLHLVFNLFWTWRFGAIVEPVLGPLATVGLFAFLGAGSSAAEWAFLDGGVGLSGVVYGLFGVLWALDRFHPGFRGVMDRRTTDLFVLWFFFCIVATYTGFMAIANVAHGAGALLGGLVGTALSPFAKRRVPALLGLGFATAVLVLASTVLRPLVNLGAYRAFAARERVYALETEAYDALRDDPARAIEILEDVIELQPDSRFAWAALAAAYEAVGREEDAAVARRRQAELERALAADPPAPDLTSE